MLNLLGHLRSDARLVELGSWVESWSRKIIDPDGVPSGVSYIAETGGSVEEPEFSWLIAGGDRRVNPLSLQPPGFFPRPRSCELGSEA